jgi:hypothetical protein
MSFLPFDGEPLHYECGEDRKEQKPHYARDESNPQYKNCASDVERIACKGEGAIRDEVIRSAI